MFLDPAPLLILATNRSRVCVKSRWRYKDVPCRQQWLALCTGETNDWRASSAWGRNQEKGFVSHCLLVCLNLLAYGCSYASKVLGLDSKGATLFETLPSSSFSRDPETLTRVRWLLFFPLCRRKSQSSESVI